jgi:hypothetical protein
LEVQRLTIQAGRDVQMEFARALANFLANGHMTLYGTPETATTMLDNMAKGFGVRSMVEGFLTDTTAKNGNGHSNGAGGGDAVSGLLSQLGGLLQPAIAKVTGTNTASVTPEMADQVAARLAENPAFQAALLEALKATAPAAPVVATADRNGI